MRIVVVGTGYVGAVTGACLADRGHQVTCIDVDQSKIDRFSSGDVPFYEPGLSELITRNTEAERLLFSLSDPDVVSKAEVVFLAVGTPPREDGTADMTYVEQASRDIAPHIRDGAVIVNKSTVPVGTGDRVREIVAEKAPSSFDVVSNPEFLREGTAVEDFFKPDRIVIGADSDRARDAMLDLYKDFACEKVCTSVRSAEMIKYASNAFLATKISFINEIANVCEEVGADVRDVAHAMGLDERIGKKFLRAGVGYGGSCFPKDVRALDAIAGQSGYDFKLLKAVIEVNAQQRWTFYNKIVQIVGDLKGKRIALWGLSFKPGTDDIRESIAIDYAKRLVDDGAIVQTYDPRAMENAKQALSGVTFCHSAMEAASNADAVVLVTEWDEFKASDWKAVADVMSGVDIFDARNALDQGKIVQAGLQHHRIG